MQTQHHQDWQQQSNEWYHSIVDWLSREPSYHVRHPQSPHSHETSELMMNEVAHLIHEQISREQSTERHHSIVDWLSREPSKLVRQSKEVHKVVWCVHHGIN